MFKYAAGGSEEEHLETHDPDVDEPLNMNVEDEDCDVDVIVDNTATTVLIEELNLNEEPIE